MVKTVKARFTKGAIVPLEPLDIEEGEEILVTLEDQVHDSTEAEDAALARAIAEGSRNRVCQYTERHGSAPGRPG